MSTQINYLNDSHAQLMVHWLGDGTNVMICLAREPPPVGPSDDTAATAAKPSSVYISYDHGDTFEDKTLLFTVLVNGTEANSTLDQFVTNQNFNTVSAMRWRNDSYTNTHTHKYPHTHTRTHSNFSRLCSRVIRCTIAHTHNGRAAVLLTQLCPFVV